MEAVINEPTNYVDRHCLLGCLVQGLFATRQVPRDRERLYRYGRMHLGELPGLMPRLLENSKGQTFHIVTFGLLEYALCEDGKPQEARAVWDVAIAIGYRDESDLVQIEAGIAKRVREVGA
jgi:hypothetical protein